MENLKTFYYYIAARSIKWYSHCGKLFSWFFEKLNIQLVHNPVPLFLDMYPKELKRGTEGDISLSVFISASFTTVKNYKQPKYLSTDEWINKMHISTQ